MVLGREREEPQINDTTHERFGSGPDHNQQRTGECAKQNPGLLDEYPGRVPTERQGYTTQ